MIQVAEHSNGYDLILTFNNYSIQVDKAEWQSSTKFRVRAQQRLMDDISKRKVITHERKMEI